jgi:hypothetical protein
VKLSELLHRRVRDEHGTDLGMIADVRLVQDGRPLAGPDHTLRVDGLIIGRRTWVVRLGLTRPDHTGPAILTHPARWFAGRHDYIPWTQVVSFEGEVVEVVGAPRRLPAPDQ